jgi:hypothetical protein
MSLQTEYKKIMALLTFVYKGTAVDANGLWRHVP